MAEPQPDPVPQAVSEATFTLFGVTLRCYVLDNGQRVIHSDDVYAFIDALAYGDGSNPNDSMESLARWLKGIA